MLKIIAKKYKSHAVRFDQKYFFFRRKGFSRGLGKVSQGSYTRQLKYGKYCYFNDIPNNIILYISGVSEVILPFKFCSCDVY